MDRENAIEILKVLGLALCGVGLLIGFGVALGMA